MFVYSIYLLYFCFMIKYYRMVDMFYSLYIIKHKVMKKKSFNQLRREINREFLIRVTFDGCRSRLMSLSLLCETFDFLHGEHLAEKALRSSVFHPTMRCKGATIVFYNR